MPFEKSFTYRTGIHRNRSAILDRSLERRRSLKDKVLDFHIFFFNSAWYPRQVSIMSECGFGMTFVMTRHHTAIELFVDGHIVLFI